MGWLWETFLYAPLLNGLIWLYQNAAGENLGLAVVELTVLLRLVLLPLSIVSERDAYMFQKLTPEIERITEETIHDPVQRTDRIRDLLRERRLHPWAKAIGLGIQLLVLVLLYRVFVDGIRAHLGDLYPWVPRPADINTFFLGQDIGVRSAVWAGAVALFLFVEIHMDQRRSPGSVTRNDVIFSLLFPLATFLVLWYLPSVKALFIMTSMLFSVGIMGLRHMLFPVKEVKA